MANLQIEATIDTSRLGILLDRLEDLSLLYKAWAVFLDAQVVEAFKAEQAPYGSMWATLQDSTIGRRQKRKSPPTRGKILRDTGKLYDSIAARFDGTGVRVGTNQQVGAYSLGAIHQFGAPRRNIPARPFLPLDSQGEPLPQVIEDLERIAYDVLVVRVLGGTRF